MGQNNKFDSIFQRLVVQIEKSKKRSLDNFLESRSSDDLLQADRAEGGLRALGELRRRLAYENEETPEWVKPALEPEEDVGSLFGGGRRRRGT